MPLALASIITGTFLAASEGHYDWVIFSLCISTTILLQVLSNFANDYGDYQHGVDNISRQGPSRTVQSGRISPSSMKAGIVLFIVLTLISGISLIYFSLKLSDISFWIFLGIGFLAILAALTYTMGGKPYGYAGFGDLFVMIFFGFVGVMGTFYLYAGYVTWHHLLPAISMGSFATAVLNVNNIRDIKSDKNAGKMSIPVRIGYRKAVIYHWILLFTGILSACIYTIIEFQSFWQWLFVISLPFIVFTGIGVTMNSEPDKLDPYLKRTALTALLFSVVFGLGMVI